LNILLEFAVQPPEFRQQSRVLFIELLRPLQFRRLPFRFGLGYASRAKKNDHRDSSGARKEIPQRSFERMRVAHPSLLPSEWVQHRLRASFLSPKYNRRLTPQPSSDAER
jgi:hypothetical protein